MKSNSNIKPISKFIAFVTAFTSIAASSGLTAFAAEEAEPAFTEKSLTALVNSIDNVASIECRYYNAMPNVPYMKLSQYYNLWTGQELAIANNNDGTYEVTVPAGVKGTYDVENDVVSTDDGGYFFTPEDELTTENPYANLYIISPEVDYTATACELDFSNYNIDIIGDESEIWVPVATLCDVYASSLRVPFFMEDTLIFGNELMSEFSITNLPLSESHSAGLLNQYSNGRPADLAEFNYNELCLAFDLNYGFPGRPYFTDLIKEKGLDGMLTEGNDTTKTIKELLLSTDFVAYNCGFDLLNMYLWDGGHTQFVALPAMYDQEFTLQAQQYAMSLGIGLENSADIYGDQMSMIASQTAILEARNAMYETADSVEFYDSGAAYIVKDNTAIFGFDSFVTDMAAWVSYYSGDAELPQELVTDFYNCILSADENPEITNFVIDLGTNTGGAVMVADYMLGLIADVDINYYKDNINDIPMYNKFDVDKNFDKVIDNKDEEFTTDLKFGVITSNMSFSCGNLFPSIARENGIMLMGEKSGGGACAINVHVTADGMPFILSSGLCLTDKDFNSIDLGIAPDYETFRVNEDGTKDFSDTYNFDIINNCFDDFYGTEIVTTTTTATTTVTTATTTTTTVTETTDTTEETTEAATTTETTASTTEATTTTTQPTTTTTNIASDDELCTWAANDYNEKTGNTAYKAEITSKGDVYEITLTDSEGKVLDVYSINPATGVGSAASGEEVNLPQTGTLSLNSLFIVLGAFALTVCGFFAVMASGIFRRKTNEE
ncbi:MAG: hypothetical protein IKV85_10610 [Ruminococcus sp.]|nr:hypothetical protein [Ruminococcus sp.]